MDTKCCAAVYASNVKKKKSQTVAKAQKTLSFTLLNFGSLRGAKLKPKPEEINIQVETFAANFSPSSAQPSSHRAGEKKGGVENNENRGEKKIGKRKNYQATAVKQKQK